MFLRSHVEIRVSPATAADALRRMPADWIPGLAVEAQDHGHRLLAEVGFPVEGRRVGKQVEIELGNPIETAGRTCLPISWKATGAQGLFPSLEGELEAAALGTELTQIGLSASYKPPFGLLGESLDRGLLHRVAEATIRDFVERVAAALQEFCRRQN